MQTTEVVQIQVSLLALFFNQRLRSYTGAQQSLHFPGKAVHTVLLCSSIPLPQLHEKLPEIQLATGKLQGTEMYKTTVFFFILKCQKLKQKLGFIFDSL